MSLSGLTEKEVRERVSSGQVNDYESPVSRSYADILIKNVCTVYNLILFILGAVLLYFGDLISTLSAVGVILLNVLIATVQEMRAKRRLDKIALLTRPTVSVVRDGKELQLDPSKIVMDDLVHLSSGDQAQVDGELLETRSLEMDESLLTGESSTRRKHTGDTIYSGSFCVTGEGYYKVAALGNKTVASEMLQSAKRYRKKSTPLQAETSTVTEALMGLAMIYLAILVVKNLLFGWDTEMFATESVIVLDIVPIALFLLITITYMIAALRMADSGVLLQNSNSVESMSHVDTVCMDKTGTITTNNLVYEGMDAFESEEYVEERIRIFVSSTGSKNRTIKALEKKFGSEASELIEEVQFSSDRKFSAVRVEFNGKRETIFMGAWPSLKARTRTDADVVPMISEISARGMRTLVLCSGPDAELYDGDDVIIPELRLIAIISIKDEVRPDCKEIIDGFMSNGMDLKVISGDDPETVDAIFSLAGIPGERNIISGDQLSETPKEELSETVLRTNIFGRMKPDQKEMIVETLKSNGRYVAMVGDGVNDVRSLKAANVGVALQSGSGAARGVADMILVNDRYAALPKAIIEGKRTVTGMRDILRLYLTRNFVLAMLVGILLLILGRMPMMIVQNTMYALISVSFAAFLMAIWAKPSENKDLILPTVLRFSLPMSIIIVAFALAIYTMFVHGTDSGMFDLGHDFYYHMYQTYGGSYGDFTQFMEHMGFDYESYADITGRNAMLVFLILSGISQLFLIYPLMKFYSVDGRVSKDLKPTILAFLLFGLLALVYFIPQVAVGIASLAIFPLEYFAIIIAATVIWLAVSVIILKRVKMKKLTEATEAAYLKSLKKTDLEK